MCICIHKNSLNQPKHITNKINVFRVIPTDVPKKATLTSPSLRICQVRVVRFYVSLISSPLASSSSPARHCLSAKGHPPYFPASMQGTTPGGFHFAPTQHIFDARKAFSRLSFTRAMIFGIAFSRQNPVTTPLLPGCAKIHMPWSLRAVKPGKAKDHNG